ncbi:MAG: hypothetical protein F4Y79_10535 [Gemmatimonadetes bacterium]|nr:hypothetical protein [Gemmatimonadota bacterium]MYF16889.1 hypothetical protein [Gemmatimonadota bacterium]
MPPRRARQRHTPTRPKLPYSERNMWLFGLGLATIALGYVFLSLPPVDGFMSLTLAPLLLVLGYCVLIPIALLSGNKKDEPSTDVR